ncbi:MAG TPA: pyridoxamine 5'-phosphate oxidase family protein [Dehalococcoidia bacterium]
MASWAEFEAGAPEIAAVGSELLERHHLAYLATVRRDGSPRVHPVSPFIIDGRLLITTPPSSPKAGDQRRDGRYMLHALPGDDDAEFSVRGRARLLSDGPDRDAIVAAGPHWLKPDDCIFEYDIEEAATAYWVNAGKPGTYPVRQRWP